jgi:hypothetical protein
MSTRLFEFNHDNSTVHTTNINVVLIVIIGAMDGLKISSILWEWQSFLTDTYSARPFFLKESILITILIPSHIILP